MKKNKICIYITVLASFLMIALPTTYKVVKKHNERLLINTVETIVEAAKDCYYNDSCINDEITLEELYEKTSLTTMSNPITKKIYNPSSYVSVKDNFTFVEK